MANRFWKVVDAVIGRKTLTVSQDEFVAVLRNTKKHRISLTFESDVKMNKKGNPFFVKEGRGFTPTASVRKETVAVYGFGKSYSDLVNRALHRKGLDANFVADRNNWAEQVIKDKVIRHKETGVLYVKVFHKSKGVNTYKVNGKTADDAQMSVIRAFETFYGANNVKQEFAGLKGAEQVRPMTVAIPNISVAKIGLKTYIIRK